MAGITARFIIYVTSHTVAFMCGLSPPDNDYVVFTMIMWFHFCTVTLLTAWAAGFDDEFGQRMELVHMYSKIHMFILANMPWFLPVLIREGVTWWTAWLMPVYLSAAAVFAAIVTDSVIMIIMLLIHWYRWRRLNILRTENLVPITVEERMRRQAMDSDEPATIKRLRVPRPIPATHHVAESD